MKYAFLDGIRAEPTPKQTANCACCGATVISKCGQQKVWHWAHRSTQDCDHWWESETEWHRGWKNYFASEWQEVIHFAENGEKHIADVKTPNGLVIEFQHSHITPEEATSRERFYKNMIWIVDGTRLKRDFIKLSRFLENDWYHLERHWIDLDKTFPNNWTNRSVPVYFDIGHQEYLICISPNGAAYKFDKSYITKHLANNSNPITESSITAYPSEVYLTTLESLLQEMNEKLKPYVRRRGMRQVVLRTRFTLPYLFSAEVIKNKIHQAKLYLAQNL